MEDHQYRSGIFKKGDNGSTENYRPISPLSNISKLLERCVLAKTRNQLFEFINQCQHGFIPGRSCTTQLVQVQKTNWRDLSGHDYIRPFTKCSTFYYLRSYSRSTSEAISTPGLVHTCWVASSVLLYTWRNVIYSIPVTSGVPQGSILYRTNTLPVVCEWPARLNALLWLPLALLTTLNCSKPSNLFTTQSCYKKIWISSVNSLCALVFSSTNKRQNHKAFPAKISQWSIHTILMATQ